MRCSLCGNSEALSDTSECELLKNNSEFLSPQAKKIILECAHARCRDHLLSGTVINDLSMLTELNAFFRDYTRITNGLRQENTLLKWYRTGGLYGMLLGFTSTIAVTSLIMVFESPSRKDSGRILTTGLVSTIGGALLGFEICRLIYSYPT